MLAGLRWLLAISDAIEQLEKLNRELLTPGRAARVEQLRGVFAVDPQPTASAKRPTPCSATNVILAKNGAASWISPACRQLGVADVGIDQHRGFTRRRTGWFGWARPARTPAGPTLTRSASGYIPAGRDEHGTCRIATLIACLGWGSLIWNPGELPVVGGWRPDGPDVRVEFVRKSGGDRLTLVLFDNATSSVPSLWAPLAVTELDVAMKMLAEREGGKKPLPSTRIGRWPGTVPETIIDLDSWAAARGVQHVIWTDLPPRFTDPTTRQDRDDCLPDEDQEVEYLGRLIADDKAAGAENYIRCAPEQIDTAYRRRFVREFGWAPRTSV